MSRSKKRITLSKRKSKLRNRQMVGGARDAHLSLYQNGVKVNDEGILVNVPTKGGEPQSIFKQQSKFFNNIMIDFKDNNKLIKYGLIKEDYSTFHPPPKSKYTLQWGKKNPKDKIQSIDKWLKDKNTKTYTNNIVKYSNFPLKSLEGKSVNDLENHLKIPKNATSYLANIFEDFTQTMKNFIQTNHYDTNEERQRDLMLLKENIKILFKIITIPNKTMVDVKYNNTDETILNHVVNKILTNLTKEIDLLSQKTVIENDIENISNLDTDKNIMDVKREIEEKIVALKDEAKKISDEAKKISDENISKTLKILIEEIRSNKLNNSLNEAEAATNGTADANSEKKEEAPSLQVHEAAEEETAEEQAQAAADAQAERVAKAAEKTADAQAKKQLEEAQTAAAKTANLEEAQSSGNRQVEATITPVEKKETQTQTKPTETTATQTNQPNKEEYILDIIESETNNYNESNKELLILPLLYLLTKQNTGVTKVDVIKKIKNLKAVFCHNLQEQAGTEIPTQTHAGTETQSEKQAKKTIQNLEEEIQKLKQKIKKEGTSQQETEITQQGEEIEQIPDVQGVQGVVINWDAYQVLVGTKQ
jgi:hypothetical protein